jgi:hypothetical protein
MLPMAGGGEHHLLTGTLTTLRAAGHTHETNTAVGAPNAL